MTLDFVFHGMSAKFWEFYFGRANEKNGKTTRNKKSGFFKTFAARLNWLEDDGYGEAPAMEQLESRLLMSANPVSEIWTQQAQDNSLGEQAVVAMPLNAGGGAAVTMNATASADVIAPTIVAFNVSNNALYNKSFEVFAYIGDRDSDTVEWQLTLENTDTGETFVYTGAPLATPGTGAPKVVFAAIDPAELGDGNYRLTLDVTDPAGNAATKTVNVRFDVTPPVIESITANKDVVETFTSTKFTINASDNTAIYNRALTINGQAVGVSSDGVATYTFKEAGDYVFVATFSDRAGNVATYSQTITVVECADLRAPTIGFNMSAYYKADVPLRFFIRDVDSLEVNWTAKVVNNATGEERLVTAGDRVFELTNVATLSVADYADGSYTLLVEAVDKGGNRAANSTKFTIDTVAPVVSIETETERFETGKMALNIVVDEANPQAYGTSLTINGKSIAVPANGRAVYDFATPGTYTLVATAKDMANNITTVTRTIEIAENTDFTPPSVDIVSPAAGSYLKGVVNLHATVTDNTDSYISWTIQLKRPNGTIGRTFTGTGPIVDVDIAQWSVLGENIVEIEVVDAAGNASVATTSYFRDTVAPKFVETNFGEFYNVRWLTSPFSITATLTDEHSPDELITWTLTAENSTTGETFTVATGTGGNVNVQINPSDHASGNYRFTLTAVDAAGNKDSKVLSTALDAHAPDIQVLGYTNDNWSVQFSLLCSDDFLMGHSMIKLVSGPEGPGTMEGSGSINTIGSRLMAGPGTYVFEIWAVDAAGNKSLPQTVSVYVPKSS